MKKSLQAVKNLRLELRLIMNNWLENYTYRISMPYLLFLLALILCVVIATVTVLTQYLKIEKMKVVDALRQVD